MEACDRDLEMNAEGVLTPALDFSLIAALAPPLLSYGGREIERERERERKREREREMKELETGE